MQKLEITPEVKTVEVPHQRSSLHQRPKDGKGTRSEVYQMDDVAGWTRVTYLFMGHGNICKSQRTIMTL
jgi:hypothetical protein